VLAEQGYRVIEASRGDEALALLDEISTNIDALVTDVIMPGMGGRQLADRLQQERPGIKVLFLSGYTDDVLGHHGVLDAGTAFLQKPFSREALTRKLRQVLDG
jgi:two-component system, cell cycle sensor histidine kinase and response regulator CckA